MQSRTPFSPLTFLAWCSAFLLALLLSACGGGESSSASASARLMGGSRPGAANVVAADYQTVAQQMYVAYYGRPADPVGLANLQAQLLAAGAPTAIDGLSTAYNNNATLRALIDTFGNSTESQQLYSGDNPRFVLSVYNNILGRDPALGGLNFWATALGNGMQRGNAALSIMAAALANSTAQGQLDTTLVTKKISAADQFSAAVSSSAYRGQQAAGIARNMLRMIDSGTDLSAFQDIINQSIDSIRQLNISSFAGAYVGTYSGADSGTFSVAISSSGIINGSGQSNSGAALYILGTLSVGGTIDMKASGIAGESGFSGGVNPATGILSGTWDAGIYGKGTFSGSKVN